MPEISRKPSAISLFSVCNEKKFGLEETINADALQARQ